MSWIIKLLKLAGFAEYPPVIAYRIYPYYEGVKREDRAVRDKISPLAPIEETGELGAGFKERVLALVAEIPEGRVATYGQVARVAGRPRAARQVGGVLRGLSESETEAVPWQRVISAQGEISTYKVGTGELQRALLESEGVAFDRRGRCDLTRYRHFFLEISRSADAYSLTGASGGEAGS